MEKSISSAVLALQRAMPIPRLLDCGMDYSDAITLFSKTNDGEAWDEVAESLADTQLHRASEAYTKGHFITANEAQAYAIAALLFAQMAFNFDVPRKQHLYAKYVKATQRLADWSKNLIKRVEVPYEDKKLIGWLVLPNEKPLGTVLLFGGQSGWSMAYLSIAKALARRGLATLLAEGPGQGETRLEQHIYVDVDVSSAYQHFVNWIATDPCLGPIGIWGNSIGGLWAGKTAALDKRINACCINGAFAFPKLLPFRTFMEQAGAMLGTQDENQIEENFKRMSFVDQDKISCSLLVLHGEADPLIKLEDQQPFLDAAVIDDVTLKTWVDGDHTIYNHASERNAFVADWFVDRLSTKK